MKKQTTKPMGRPAIDPEHIRRAFSLSLTKAEAERLDALAKAADQSRSEYVVIMLGLNKKV